MYVNERCRDNPKARRWIENDLLFLYAGPAAEARVFGWNPRGSMVDVAWAKLHAGYLHRGEAARAACLRSGRARAVEFVSEPQQWVQIEALAEVLVVRGELSSRKARAVCEAAKQGLRFQELIEAENRRIQEGIKQSDECTSWPSGTCRAGGSCWSEDCWRSLHVLPGIAGAHYRAGVGEGQSRRERRGDPLSARHDAG